MPVTIAEVGSGNASKRALQQRSAAVEKVIELSSSPRASHTDVTAQQACLIGRNPEGFAAAAKQAGLKILRKVQLTPQAVAAIKAELPTTMTYMLKRLFHSELGVDIFGPLDKLGRTLEPFKFTYEYGTVDVSVGGTVQQVKFLWVTDVAHVVKKTYLQLQEHGLLAKQASYKKQGVTRWMASGDKGGKSTKLPLQCLDTASTHSVRHAQLLAFFEGAKDCHGPVNAVFGPVLSSLHDVIEDIGDLQLTSGQHKISRASLVHGGDWLYQASLLGLTGPNGDYFCSKCLIRLPDIRKGMPHSFSPHKRQCSLDGTTSSPITAPAHTMQGIYHDHAEFVTAGSPKGKAAAFKNCERPCIIKGNGSVIHHISCMPLHISLGLGTQALDMIEAEALRLDRHVKEVEGKASSELTAAYARRKQLAEELKEKTKGLEEQKENDDQLEFQLSHVSLPQAEVKKIQREKKLLAAQIKSTKNQLKQTEAALHEVEKIIIEQQGPFQQALQQQLDKLQLQRAKYHNRTLVGNDVHKLMQAKSMKAITNILKPQSFSTPEGANTIVGCHKLAQRCHMLLNKFQQCYSLYTACRILTQQEVDLLEKRCTSFGNWFPYNFPDENMKRKFHELVVHVPEKARLFSSVGLESEQAIEALHPKFNRWATTFAAVTKDSTRFGAIAEKQWLQSDAALPQPRQASKRKCSRCGQEGHYKKKCILQQKI